MIRASGNPLLIRHYIYYRIPEMKKAYGLVSTPTDCSQMHFNHSRALREVPRICMRLTLAFSIFLGLLIDYWIDCLSILVE